MASEFIKDTPIVVYQNDFPVVTTLESIYVNGTEQSDALGTYIQPVGLKVDSGEDSLDDIVKIRKSEKSSMITLVATRGNLVRVSLESSLITNQGRELVTDVGYGSVLRELHPHDNSISNFVCSNTMAYVWGCLYRDSGAKLEIREEEGNHSYRVYLENYSSRYELFNALCEVSSSYKRLSIKNYSFELGEEVAIMLERDFPICDGNYVFLFPKCFCQWGIEARKNFLGGYLAQKFWSNVLEYSKSDSCFTVKCHSHFELSVMAEMFREVLNIKVTPIGRSGGPSYLVLYFNNNDIWPYTKVFMKNYFEPAGYLSQKTNPLVNRVNEWSYGTGSDFFYSVETSAGSDAKTISVGGLLFDATKLS